MNIHHLELFFYVARHGGITEAVRKMPYGIQQPAVSAQLLQLENVLGVALFQRRPFRLTAAGDKLYRFIQPFFENLDAIAEEIRNGSTNVIRIGSSDVILRDHLPEVIEKLRPEFPSIKLTLRSAYQPDLIDGIEKLELDVALTLLDKSIPPGLHSQSITSLPLVLLVNRRRKMTGAADLLRRGRVHEPLLALPPSEVICRSFQDGLRARSVQWAPTMELSSLELISTYVENDYGFGLSLALPGRKFSRKIRVLELPDFPLVDFGVVWRGEPTPFLASFIKEVPRRAESVSKPSQAADSLRSCA